MKAFVSTRISSSWLEKLSQKFDVEHYDWSKEGVLSPEDFNNRVRDCHVLVVETDIVSADAIRQSPDLFAIVDFRGTVVNVDIPAANEKGIIIINTPGRNADAVADLTVALMVMAARNVMPAMKALHDGLWKSNGRYWMYNTHQGYDLPGKTVGLIGLGLIGKRVAKRLQGYDANLIGYDPFVNAAQALQYGIQMVTLDEIFQKSDFVSLHLPLNSETKERFGTRELSLMKPTAYLINTSRAGVFKESELIAFLQTGKIAGAALDVYHEEPLESDHPLLDIPYVICTPHIGGASLDVINHQSEIGIGALLDYLDGKQPANIINPEVFEKSIERMLVFNR